MSSVALKVEDVVIAYEGGPRRKVAVSHLSFDVFEGELFALLGPNGAGKTSLISAMTGLIPFEAGQIEIFGHPAGTEQAKRLLGVVPQELIGYGFFTVSEILKFYSGYYGLRKNESRIQELLGRLQLESVRDQRVSALSGGMKRRLLIAKALLHSPRLLLLDEPSAGVDVELRAILLDFVKEINQKGTTIILTTHYLEEAQRLCRRSAILHHGKLLALDDTGALIQSLSKEGSLEEAFLKLVRGQAG